MFLLTALGRRFFVESVGKLSIRNLDIFDDAKDVGELEAEELDPFFLGALEDRLLFTRACGVTAAAG